LVDREDAVVRVEATAICGTDLHAVAGHLTGVPAGTRLGHEFVGTITELGPAVTGLQIGDRVVGSDFTCCGRCAPCRRGQHWHCGQRAFLGTGTAFGPELAGAQAEAVRVPLASTSLGRVPADLDPRLAVLMSDNLATAFCALAAGRLQPGETLAVVGGGAVGQLCSLAAQLSGAGVVVVSDPVESRRLWAREHGALACEPGELVDRLAPWTDGQGADLVLEAVGGSRGLDAALAADRPGGRVISVSAHAEPTWPLPLASVFARELAIGFVIGDAVRARDRMLSLAAAGLLVGATDLVAARPLEDAVAAYAAATGMQAMKLLLVP
jgi:threonine dehydrogenase-like Zn-dependent dehydrogenase